MIVISFTSIAQNEQLFIAYDYDCKTNNYTETLELIADQKACLSTVTRIFDIGGKAVIDAATGEVSNKNGNTQELRFYTHYFHDLSAGNMISTHTIDQPVFVKEQMNQMQWKFTQQTDSILGYQCSKATTSFRGREYTAWFTTQLPFKASPWKIHGLPGVVLKFSSNDDFISAEAVKLKISNATQALVNPNAKEKTVNWNEYVIIYKKFNKEVYERNRKFLAMSGQPMPDFMGKDPQVEIIDEKINRCTYEIYGAPLK
jgi:GLPGLI family protein